MNLIAIKPFLISERLTGIAAVCTVRFGQYKENRTQFIKLIDMSIFRQQKVAMLLKIYIIAL